MAGTFGLMGSFSFFHSHHISTMEGGMVVTDDEELYHILLSLRAHGWTRDLPDDSLIIDKKRIDSFYEPYRFVLPGYNLRPTEIQGAIGIQQLKRLPGFIVNRRNNAKLYWFTFHRLTKITEIPIKIKKVATIPAINISPRK